MKHLMLLAATAAMMMAQDAAKVAPPKDAPASAIVAPSERALTETEVLKLQLAAEKIKNLQSRYKIEDYQKDIQPVLADQETVAMAACRSVGIPDDKIKNECSLNLGLAGPDGKPTPAKVWWNKPTQQPSVKP